LRSSLSLSSSSTSPSPPPRFHLFLQQLLAQRPLADEEGIVVDIVASLDSAAIANVDSCAPIQLSVVATWSSSCCDRRSRRVRGCRVASPILWATVVVAPTEKKRV